MVFYTVFVIYICDYLGERDFFEGQITYFGQESFAMLISSI